MKIVSLVWFKVFPAKYGGQKGIALFQKYLAGYFDITCLCSKDNEVDASMPFSIRPELPVSKSQFLNPAGWNTILRIVKEEKAELLLLEHPYHVLAALRLKKRSGMKLILHEHNIEFQRFRDLHKWWWKVLKKMEGRACRQSDLVFFKTENDRRMAMEIFGLDDSRCMVLPYGIERKPPVAGSREMIQEKHGIGPEEKIILFAGTLDYEPNAKAVEQIFQKLAPELSKLDLSFRILICGRNKFRQYAYLDQLKQENVLMVGEVEGIDVYLQAADVMIDPVLTGGGIQTKILDALSQHCNVVAFERSLSGIDLSMASNKIWKVEDGNWKEMAVSVKDASTKKEPTPEAFFSVYHWEVLAKKAADAIMNLYRRSTDL